MYISRVKQLVTRRFNKKIMANKIVTFCRYKENNVEVEIFDKVINQNSQYSTNNKNMYLNQCIN